MTNEQTERLLEQLTRIADVLAEMNEVLVFAMDTNDEGENTLRVVDVVQSPEHRR